MPLLLRQPGVGAEPAAWTLEVNEEDEEAREILAGLLAEAGPGAAELELSPGSAAPRIRFELDEAAPVMAWRAIPGGLGVRLSRTALKALVELWNLSAQGAGEYSLEVAGVSPAGTAQATYLTLRPGP
ncbi:MAG: hypothetical protein M5U26_07400 [Planctomycetota bacterium]|nr:hypothetical protein [Planctomycetota bacterium]